MSYFQEDTLVKNVNNSFNIKKKSHNLVNIQSHRKKYSPQIILYVITYYNDYELIYENFGLSKQDVSYIISYYLNKSKKSLVKIFIDFYENQPDFIQDLFHSYYFDFCDADFEENFKYCNECAYEFNSICLFKGNIIEYEKRIKSNNFDSIELEVLVNQLKNSLLPSRNEL